jgi:hypothetical protein
LVCVAVADLADGTGIGRFHVITRIGRFETGCDAGIGHFNIIRGGECIKLSVYSEVTRFSALNAILDHDRTTKPQSVLEVGRER